MSAPRSTTEWPLRRHMADQAKTYAHPALRLHTRPPSNVVTLHPRNGGGGDDDCCPDDVEAAHRDATVLQDASAKARDEGLPDLAAQFDAAYAGLLEVEADPLWRRDPHEAVERVTTIRLARAYLG